MKLQDIPRDSKILLSIGNDEKGYADELCTFKHPDGMYSLIYTEEGHAVHLGRMTEVELKGDHYEIVESTPLPETN